ncbi:hypothetical protein VP01_8617g1 [Puccinia sorghi]|uniref:Uncharacterized protein n=1 Tax=Puccinia sorghi TaxID=27349 RepID=A0A0L6UB13_9BASI|nr:hypothetical protein VP01_8617g1 [Puccinia sorghi]
MPFLSGSDLMSIVNGAMQSFETTISYFNATMFYIQAIVPNVALILSICSGLLIIYRLSKNTFAWFKYKPCLEKEPKSSLAMPPTSLEFENLAIFDSLYTFSQSCYTDDKGNLYKQLIEMCRSSDSLAGNHDLIATLTRSWDLTQKLNRYLQQIAARGFHAMIIFVFQVVII